MTSTETNRPGPEHFRRLERAYLAAPTNAYYRPRIRIETERAEIVIPLRAEFLHAGKAAHGSVYFKALDDAAFFSANSVVADVFLLTASFQIDLLRPVSHGEIRATGRLLHASRRLFIADALLHDADGKLLARGSGSFMRSAIALDENVGYR